MRERGAWGAPWVEPVASGEAGLMRVSARAPDRPLFPATRPEEFACSPGRITPRGLTPMSARRFIVSGRVRSPAWTLRFLSPEAMPSPSVSPRNRHAGLQDLLLGHAPVATGLLCSITCAAARKATPTNCPDILKCSDVFEDLPRS